MSTVLLNSILTVDITHTYLPYVPAVGKELPRRKAMGCEVLLTMESGAYFKLLIHTSHLQFPISLTLNRKRCYLSKTY